MYDLKYVCFQICLFKNMFVLKYVCFLEKKHPKKRRRPTDRPRDGRRTGVRSVVWSAAVCLVLFIYKQTFLIKNKHILK